MNAFDRAQSRWQATTATRAADKARAGGLRLLAAIQAMPADPPALMGITDPELDEEFPNDVADLLAHRLNRHPEEGTP